MPFRAGRDRTGPVSSGVEQIRPMAPWRIAGALALSAAFGLIGWQVQRLIQDQPWSDPLMWGAAAAGVVAACCLLIWTWVATDNGRRLIGPATNRELPDPLHAVVTWILPLSSRRPGSRRGRVPSVRRWILGADDTVAAIPLAVAVVALLLAIPLSYRPLHYLAGVVRQVGGRSARLAQWMWVPVVLGLVGHASLVALRLGAVDDRRPLRTVDSDRLGAASGWLRSSRSRRV